MVVDLAVGVRFVGAVVVGVVSAGSRVWFDSCGEEPVVYAPIGGGVIAGDSVSAVVLHVGACGVRSVSLPFNMTQGTLTDSASGVCVGGELLCVHVVVDARVIVCASVGVVQVGCASDGEKEKGVEENVPSDHYDWSGDWGGSALFDTV